MLNGKVVLIRIVCRIQIQIQNWRYFTYPTTCLRLVVPTYGTSLRPYVVGRVHWIWTIIRPIERDLRSSFHIPPARPDHAWREYRIVASSASLLTSVGNEDTADVPLAWEMGVSRRMNDEEGKVGGIVEMRKLLSVFEHLRDERDCYIVFFDEIEQFITITHILSNEHPISDG